MTGRLGRALECGLIVRFHSFRRYAGWIASKK